MILFDHILIPIDEKFLGKTKLTAEGAEDDVAAEDDDDDDNDENMRPRTEKQSKKWIHFMCHSITRSTSPSLPLSTEGDHVEIYSTLYHICLVSHNNSLIYP